MQPKSLRADWIDRIFSRMQGVYGGDFTNYYSRVDHATGIDIGLENAKVVWAEELATFHDWPEAIAYALQNLPERPPNVVKFREMCRHAPPKVAGPLLENNQTQEQFDRTKSVAKKVLSGLQGASYRQDPKGWATQLLENPFYPDGRPRPKAVLDMAREALK